MQPVLRVGVVADTHIPDRVKTFHPGLLQALEKARVDHILHAGDVSTQWVIERLREIAPVDAARGNRDFTLPWKVKWVSHLQFAGVPLALMHGHGNLFQYFLDKYFYLSQGYRLERYLPILMRDAKDARVIVFGHTHHRVNTHHQGVLLFNPGSASFGLEKGMNPSWGLLKFYADASVEAEIFELEGYRYVKGEWTPNLFEA